MQNIILLHGALGSSADFEPLKKSLSKFPHKLYAMSFSGHGQSAFQKEFGIAQFAKEVELFIADNKISDPNIFGFSMGGYVALHLAGTRPGLLNKIITLGTKFEWSDQVIEKQKKFLDPSLIEKNVALATHLKSVHGSKLSELLKKTTAMLYDIASQNTLSAGFLATIHNKALIGLADKDQMVTLAETTNVYKNLPEANMYMLPRSKHPIESANLRVLSEIINDFVS